MCRGSTPYALSREDVPLDDMATASAQCEWVVLSEPGCLPFLYNTATERIHKLAIEHQGEPSHALLPEDLSADFNMLGGQECYLDAAFDTGQSWTQSPAGPWMEYTDTMTGRQYWDDEITGERTWDCPIIEYQLPPPPPSTPSPPPSTPPTKASAPYEKDQWFQYTNTMGAVVWYNIDTGKTQENKPKCMMKYR